MTAPFDPTQYRHTLERWRALADRRLEHMTVLYDTGRWRRYFTEEKFLEVIRETRAAADMWHQLAPVDAEEALFTLAAEQALGRPMLPSPSPYTTPLPELGQVA
jgi:uncharacterized repeat protein (TIGR03809 family)